MATQDIEEMMALDRRGRIVKGVLGLIGVLAVLLIIGYVIASGFVTV